MHITAAGDRQALVQELVRVMELEPADGSEDASQLVFAGPKGISSLIAAGNGDVQLVYEDSRLRLWWLGARQGVI